MGPTYTVTLSTIIPKLTTFKFRAAECMQDHGIHTRYFRKSLWLEHVCVSIFNWRPRLSLQEARRGNVRIFKS